MSESEDLVVVHLSSQCFPLLVVADQAELHGLLVKVRDLGVTLLSVEIADPPEA